MALTCISTNAGALFQFLKIYAAADTKPFSESAVLIMQQKLVPHFHFVGDLFFRSIIYLLVTFRALGSHISKSTYFLQVVFTITH